MEKDILLGMVTEKVSVGSGSGDGSGDGSGFGISSGYGLGDGSYDCLDSGSYTIKGSGISYIRCNICIDGNWYGHGSADGYGQGIGYGFSNKSEK